MGNSGRCRILLELFALLLVVFSNLGSVSAQESSLLTDVNGDGIIRVLAFGDSITYGVGDGTLPGQEVSEAPRTDGRGGYCARMETTGGFLVDNRGVPGEELSNDGVARFPGVVASSQSDIVILFEGSNDALNKIDAFEFERDYQRAINVARFLGKTPVVVTLPPTCCDRAGRTPFIDALNTAIGRLASRNEIHLADLKHAFETTCNNVEECNLLNLPEGLHPNSVGYDVVSQLLLATLTGIDIFSPTGAADLEAAYNLPAGTVIVKPDPAAVQTIGALQ